MAIIALVGALTMLTLNTQHTFAMIGGQSGAEEDQVERMVAQVAFIVIYSATQE